MDKTGLITYTNKYLNTEQKYICVSRPRRFGKSMALKMLAAYYSRGCDSRDLFKGFKIEGHETYSESLNRYDVIYLNMQQFLIESGNQGVSNYLEKEVFQELREEYGELIKEQDKDKGIASALRKIYVQTRKKYIFLIDEWDCVMRERQESEALQRQYLDFLRNLLKDQPYVALKFYMDMDFDSLRTDIVWMLGGGRTKVNTRSFQNDMYNFKTKDDVLTLLIHLGYLAYDAEAKETFIPNKEIIEEFENAMSVGGWPEVMRILKSSEKLLEATLRGDEKSVAEGLDLAHMEASSILTYNDENSRFLPDDLSGKELAVAIGLAYYSARKDYRLIREFPTGCGFADIVFLPLPSVGKPALVVELKYDKSADTALKQIKDRKYTQALESYTGEILLVGINYDRENKNKPHSCVIERVRK